MDKFVDKLVIILTLIVLMLFATHSYGRDLTPVEQGAKAKAWIEAQIKTQRDKNPKGFDEYSAAVRSLGDPFVYVIIIDNREVKRGNQEKIR